VERIGPRRSVRCDHQRAHRQAVRGHAGFAGGGEMKVQMKEIFFPDIFVANSKIVPLDEEVPKSALGYRIVERTEEQSEDGELIHGKWKQVGNQVVFGKILTLKDVEPSSILHDNMVSNGWEKVVRTTRGMVINFTKDMEVVERV
jgi:hypothetical protein